MGRMIYSADLVVQRAPCLKEVEVIAALVGGGRINGNNLVDPPGRLGQYVALHHLRNQDEALLGELVDLLIGQHVNNVGGRIRGSKGDFWVV